MVMVTANRATAGRQLWSLDGKQNGGHVLSTANSQRVCVVAPAIPKNLITYSHPVSQGPMGPMGGTPKDPVCIKKGRSRSTNYQPHDGTHPRRRMRAFLRWL